MPNATCATPCVQLTGGHLSPAPCSGCVHSSDHRADGDDNTLRWCKPKRCIQAEQQTTEKQHGLESKLEAIGRFTVG